MSSSSGLGSALRVRDRLAGRVTWLGVRFRLFPAHGLGVEEDQDFGTGGISAGYAEVEPAPLLVEDPGMHTG